MAFITYEDLLDFLEDMVVEVSERAIKYGGPLLKELNPNFVSEPALSGSSPRCAVLPFSFRCSLSCNVDLTESPQEALPPHGLWRRHQVSARTQHLQGRGEEGVLRLG